MARTSRRKLRLLKRGSKTSPIVLCLLGSFDRETLAAVSPMPPLPLNPVVHGCHRSLLHILLERWGLRQSTWRKATVIEASVPRPARRAGVYPVDVLSPGLEPPSPDDGHLSARGHQPKQRSQEG